MKSGYQMQNSSDYLQQNKGAPDSWCPLPWSHISIKGNGVYRLCCHSNVSENHGVLRDKKGKPFHIGTADWESVANSNTMKTIRKNMLKGTWSSECIRCKREFNSGMKSRNIHERALLAETTEPENYPGYLKAKALTQPDGSISQTDFPVSLLDIRFGNLCNLRCAMCSPTDSSAWYKEHYAVWGSHFKDSGKTVQLLKDSKGKITTKEGVFDWSGNKNLWSQIDKYIHQFRRIYIAGGEPLLMKDYYKFLENCIESGVAEKLLIEFNSNITRIPEKTWQIWKHFGKIIIGISLDGVGEINDFIRYPGKWNRIEGNMQRLDEEGGNLKCYIAASVSVLNIWHLPKFIEYVMKKNYKRIGFPKSSLINPHPVHKPYFLNINILEESFKEEVRKYFENYKDRISNFDWQSVCGDSHIVSWERKVKRACDILDNYVEFMYKISYQTEELIKWRSYFIYFMDKMDELRGLCWKNTFPELYRSSLKWRKLKEKNFKKAKPV